MYYFFRRGFVVLLKILNSEVIPFLLASFLLLTPSFLYPLFSLPPLVLCLISCFHPNILPSFSLILIPDLLFLSLAFQSSRSCCLLPLPPTTPLIICLDFFLPSLHRSVPTLFLNSNLFFFFILSLILHLFLFSLLHLFLLFVSFPSCFFNIAKPISLSFPLSSSPFSYSLLFPSNSFHSLLSYSRTSFSFSTLFCYLTLLNVHLFYFNQQITDYMFSFFYYN